MITMVSISFLNVVTRNIASLSLAFTEELTVYLSIRLDVNAWNSACIQKRDQHGGNFFQLKISQTYEKIPAYFFHASDADFFRRSFPLGRHAGSR